MKKLLSILIASMMLVSVLFASNSVVFASNSNIVSDSTAENMTYYFDKATGELTIDGYGMIWTTRNITDSLIAKSIQPTEILKLTVRDGITILHSGMILGNFPGYDEWDNLTEVTLPKSIKKIDFSFDRCKSLKTINYAGTKADWNKIIISDDNALSKMKFNYSVNVEKSTTGKSGKGNEIKTEKLNKTVTCTYNYITNELVISGKGATKTTVDNACISNILFATGSSSDYEGNFGVHFNSVIVKNGITELCEANFQNEDELKSITIPKSVTKIGDNCFSSNHVLNSNLEVYYEGSKEDWNKIKIGKQNGILINGNIHFKQGASENTPSKTETQKEPNEDTQKKSPNTGNNFVCASTAVVLVGAAMTFAFLKKKKNK